MARSRAVTTFFSACGEGVSKNYSFGALHKENLNLL
jgi:hypothetical protein